MTAVDAAYARVFGGCVPHPTDPPKIHVLNFYTLKMKAVLHYLDSLLPKKERSGIEKEKEYAQMMATAMFAFIPPGTSCGDIISQCIASPLTQDFLDSTHHKADVADIEEAANDDDDEEETDSSSNGSASEVSEEDDSGSSIDEEDGEDDDAEDQHHSQQQKGSRCSNPKQLVMAIFNGRKVDTRGIVRWRIIKTTSSYPPPPAPITYTASSKHYYTTPAVLFTNNTHPAFTHWYHKYGVDVIVPDPNHLNSILLLARTNRSLYSFLYGRVKRLFSSEVNLAYLSIFISVLCSRPRCITALNRSFIGNKRDRLSAACFENPRKVFVDGAIHSDNITASSSSAKGEQLNSWTPASFAFGFLPTHVGIGQSGYRTSVIAPVKQWTCKR